MEQGDSGGGSKFKVVDRRRFDSGGDSKTTSEDLSRSETRSAASEAKKPAQPSSHTASSIGAERGPEFAGESGISFGSFIMSLATQAMMQMGEMAPPDGMQLPQDIEGARQTISILEMLRQKSNGNLDEEEQKLMTDILHSLKIRFVRAAKR